MQQRGLIFANIKFKLGQQITSLRSIQQNDGPLFKGHAHEFLGVSQERMKLGGRVRRNTLFKEADNLAEKISNFKERIKVPLMNRLFWEIDNAMQIADEEILASDAFNPCCDENKEEKTLLNFYGTEKLSTFKGNVNSAAPLFIVPDDVNFWKILICPWGSSKGNVTKNFCV